LPIIANDTVAMCVMLPYLRIVLSKVAQRAIAVERERASISLLGSRHWRPTETGQEVTSDRSGRLRVAERPTPVSEGKEMRAPKRTVEGGSVWRIGSERHSWSRNTVQPDLRELAKVLAREMRKIC
jgi:hypothetical protein